MPLPPLSAASISHRAEIARLLIPLRRVRPRVPFWKLAAHRIPTLWTLYRGLLRSAPSEEIQFRTRALFRMGKKLTSPQKTKNELEKGHRWLDAFQEAERGNERWRRVLRRYSGLISVRMHKTEWKEIERAELRRLEALANRPIMTGAFHRATIYNKPLPRLKPQPIEISGMINWRRKARERRGETSQQWEEWRSAVRDEMKAENSLGLQGVYGGPQARKEWEEPIQTLLNSIKASYKLDDERASTPYTPEQLARLRKARRERPINLSRLRARERRGEILRQTVKRMRQGPPAHVLAKMTNWEKERDRILRSGSWGGFAGHVKRSSGMKAPRGFEEDNF